MVYPWVSLCVSFTQFESSNKALHIIIIIKLLGVRIILHKIGIYSYLVEEILCRGGHKIWFPAPGFRAI